MACAEAVRICSRCTANVYGRSQSRGILNLCPGTIKGFERLGRPCLWLSPPSRFATMTVPHIDRNSSSCASDVDTYPQPSSSMPGTLSTITKELSAISILVDSEKRDPESSSNGQAQSLESASSTPNLDQWRVPEPNPKMYTGPYRGIGRADDYGCGQLPPPRFSIAPMMEYTDNHYRYFARLLTRHTWLWTEMVVDSTINHKVGGEADRWLEFNVCQKPVVLQLGGSKPETLAAAARVASQYGYTEINLNTGCPSERVAGAGCFGAQLMQDPFRVAACTSAIAEASGLPVTVKCRIGVDDFDTYDWLCHFIRVVSEHSPVRHFIIHARKAFLKGLSPAQNRTVPPLRREYALALARDFPHLSFTINGVFKGCHDAAAACAEAKELGYGNIEGIMVGRAAVDKPWTALADADRAVYGAENPCRSRRHLIEQYVEYAKAAVGRDKPGLPSARQLMKPLLNLFHGERNCSLWKKSVDAALREHKTLEDVLAQTLPVLPDEVLDAPPPIVPPSQSPLLFQAPLPQCQETEISAGYGLDVRLGKPAKELVTEVDQLVAGAA